MSDDTPELSDLDMAMMIAWRCCEEGSDAKLRGLSCHSCPYDRDLEKSAWLDGWSGHKDRALSDECASRRVYRAMLDD